MMIREACVENFTNVPEVIARGAERIELCDNLAVGGTTVSAGVAATAIRYCHHKNVKVMSMIRPRGGNFIYSNEEVGIMKQDLLHLKQLGTDGAVFGCLNEANWIDEEAMLSLIEVAQGVDITFHMAFDQILPDHQFKAIDWLVEHGVQRILTHGGSATSKIEDNITRIQEYIDYAANRIIILPGGGITNDNLRAIAAELSINEVHGTRIVG
jgi:copper homeostasis protein